jgi:uncharacterized protein (TIGR03435 family)
MRSTVCSSLIFFAAAIACGAQSADASAFEVASVKPAGPLQRGRPIGMRGGPGSSDPGQITYNYVTLQEVLQRAYNLQEFEISGPEWLANERYDITAKVPAGTSKERFSLMLQNLLADRLHLKAHRETREGKVYELTIGKGEPKLKESPPESAADAAPPATVAPAGPLVMKRGTDGVIELPDSMHGKGHVAMRSFLGTEIRVRREDLSYLLDRLIAELHRPVVDKTGLTGHYDYSLRFLPEAMAANAQRAQNDGAPAASDLPPDVFTAVQSQLGLKLDVKKVPGEVLVIDRADKAPTEN